ncbi:MAG: adenosylmethionine decarboxylase [Candidatus Aenigmatarchaeota archaeon]
MEQKVTVGFGPHLTLDMYGCDKQRLLDDKFIYNLLDKLPEKIGMHKIFQPVVNKFTSNPLGKKDSFDRGGVSAFVLIAESHITIHTFAAQRFASIDIFSCKEFDVEKAEKYLMRAFSAKKAEKNLLLRGKEFPKNVEVVKPIVAAERKSIVKKRY